MFAAESKAIAVPIQPGLNSEIAVTWKQIAGPIEPFLEAVSLSLRQQADEFDPKIISYAEYALVGQGKQLRPTLVAMSALATGKLNDSHITVAMIIEMVHLATLVHDDVMDEAEIRRGRQTIGAHWGNEIAVLFGDCLFAQASKLAASFPTPEICRAVASATNTVCSGEILQTQQRRNFELTQPEYFKILEMKTGELFSLSCDLGAYLNGKELVERTAMRSFGIALGTAYQIYDDCVDLFGSEAAVGKSLGTDIAQGKLTLPVLQFWEQADQKEKMQLAAWVKDWRPQYLGGVLALLGKYDILSQSIATIHRYLEQARQHLNILSPAADIRGLDGLVQFLARQTDSLGAAA